MSIAANWKSRLERASCDGAVCVRFQDRRIVDMGQIEAISDELSSLADEGARLVLNLSGVEFLSSTALNKLVSLERKIRTRAGRLALCSLTATVRDVFAITRLSDLFSIYDTETAAVAKVSAR